MAVKKLLLIKTRPAAISYNKSQLSTYSLFIYTGTCQSHGTEFV